MKTTELRIGNIVRNSLDHMRGTVLSINTDMSVLLREEGPLANRLWVKEQHLEPVLLTAKLMKCNETYDGRYGWRDDDPLGQGDSFEHIGFGGDVFRLYKVDEEYWSYQYGNLRTHRGYLRYMHELQQRVQDAGIEWTPIIRFNVV